MIKKRTLLKRASLTPAAVLLALLVPLVLMAQVPELAVDAGEGSLLTLEQALALARRNNPRLRATRALVQFPEAELAQAYRYSNPVLGFGVLPGLNAGTGVSVSLSKSFEIAGQRGLRANASRARIDAADWDVADVERRLQVQVAQAFYSVRVTQDLVQLVDSVVAVNARLVEAARLKFEAGLAPVLDQNIARIQLLQIQVQRAQILSELAVQKTAMNALTGRLPESDFTAAGPLLRDRVPGELSAAALQRYARTNRADARAIEKRGVAASTAINLARRQAFPSLIFGLGFNRDADGLQTVGLQTGVALPFFNRNQLGRDVAVAERDVITAQQLATSLAIAQEVRAALARLESARVQLDTYQDEILAQADSSQTFAALAYARGELDITTAVLTQRQHTDAHVGYLAAVLAFNRAAVELEGAVGAPLATLTSPGKEENGS